MGAKRKTPPKVVAPSIVRPRPSEALTESYPERFVPAEGMADWVRDTFLTESSSLWNQEHFHLQQAEIGFLWTNVPNSRQGRHVVGTAELMPPQAMGKWLKARAEYQIIRWFGHLPDFLITLDAPWCAQASDAQFCAVLEHELSHCAQEVDEFGSPRFRKDGRPKYALRGHDIEEFYGVIARYGLAAPGIAQLIETLKQPAKFSATDIAVACGTCAVRAA